MRVFLKASAAPTPGPAPRDEPPRTNGNGGSHGNGGELSAFREVLTEFRNLTERYGQALLALGEARGEVAGLRSRVELLEARLELRLPSARDDSPIAWGTASASSASTPEPPIPASVEAVMPAPAPMRRGPRPRPRKARSKKIAMTGFADALARAQDPSVAGVADALPEEDVAAEPIEDVAAEPVAEPIEDVFAELVIEPFEGAVAEPLEDADVKPIEDVVAEPVAEPFDGAVAEPVAEPFEDVAAEPIAEPIEAVPAEPFEAAVAEPFEAVVAEPVAEPIEAVAAEPEAPEPTTDMGSEASADVRDETADLPGDEPESDVAAPTYSAAVVEPDWFADGDFAWLDAADVEASSQPGPTAVPATLEAELTQVADADPVSAVDADPEAESPIVAQLEMEAEVSPVPEDPEPEPGIDAAVAVEPQSVFDQEEVLEPEQAVELAPVSEPEPIHDHEAHAAPGLIDTEMPVEPEPLVEPQLTADDEPHPVAAADADFSVDAESPPSDEHAEPIDVVEHESGPAPADPGPIARGHVDPDPVPELPSPGGEEEVMWIGDDREATLEMKAASPTLPVAPARWETAESEAWPAADSASKAADSARPPLAMTEDELAQLARDEGWNDAEVAAIRAMIWRPGSQTAALPGGEELDEAIAALDAVPVEATHEPRPPREWAKSVAAQGSPPTDEDWTFELEPTLDQLPAPRSVPRRPTSEPGRARRRKGPAATAYRRLRRLFPG